MSQYHLQRGALASLVYVILSAMIPTVARADIPLIRGDVDAFQNQVEIWLRGGPNRPIRSSDWLSLGDAIRTRQGAQVDLRFNEGSLARVGELATFWFVPNTRTLRLSNGTALFLIPPGNGSTTVETPNVVTQLRGTAVVVRYFPPDVASMTQPPDVQGNFETDAGRTAVMVLTDNSGGPVDVSLRDGRTVSLSAGQLAIVDNGDIYLFEFDLALFYETSPLVEGLALAEPNTSTQGQATDAIRQETWEELASQQEFEGDYLLNPKFLSPEGDTSLDGGWLFPTSAGTDNASPQSSNSSNSDTNASADEPSSPPHGSSGSAIDLVPPDDDASLDSDLLPPGNDGDDNPNVLPPGLINPNPGDLPPSLEPPEDGLPEGQPSPEVEPPSNN